MPSLGITLLGLRMIVRCVSMYLYRACPLVVFGFQAVSAIVGITDSRPNSGLYLSLYSRVLRHHWRAIVWTVGFPMRSDMSTKAWLRASESMNRKRGEVDEA